VKLTALIEHELDDVNRVYDIYTEKLKGIVETPVIPEGYVSSFAQYTIKLKNKEQRDMLQAKLKENNIPSMIYYVKPMHKQDAFSGLEYNDSDFEVTNELCEIVLSLPMYPHMTEDDIRSVTNTICKYINN
jgi:dTDP-4-amino-4,6-dideoxygalactose transaminase